MRSRTARARRRTISARIIRAARSATGPEAAGKPMEISVWAATATRSTSHTGCALGFGAGGGARSAGGDDAIGANSSSMVGHRSALAKPPLTINRAPAGRK
jgi:hypothetical protein